MNFLWFILAGLVSGLFAGMGMGGGTFLIPIITIILGVGQAEAQLVNLIVFSLTSIVVLFIQSKNKLLDFKWFFYIAVPACLVAGLGAIFALSLHSKVLKICFAAFLCLIGVAQIVMLIINKQKENKNAK